MPPILFHRSSLPNLGFFYFNEYFISIFSESDLTSKHIILSKGCYLFVPNHIQLAAAHEFRLLHNRPCYTTTVLKDDESSMIE